MASRNYLLLKPGNGYQMANKKKAMAIMAKHFGGEVTSHESMDIAGWGDCQVAAYTSTSGAMIINAADPRSFGELPWHDRDHLVMLREIPDNRQPRCAIYICRIKDLFDAPAEEWVGKAGVKWPYVSKVAKQKEVHASQDLARLLNGEPTS